MTAHRRAPLGALAPGALAGALALGACHAGPLVPPDLLAATSSTVVPAVDGSTLYVVDQEQGRVDAFDLDTRTVRAVDVGLEPTRITRGVDRLYVAVRGGDEVVALEDRGGDLEVVARAPVGVGPFGVVASQDGGPLYVGVAGEDRVLELDPDTLEVRHGWSVAGEPRWLALEPAGRALYVATVDGSALVRLDLLDREVDSVELPRVGGAPARATGEPCVTTDGGLVAVPVLVEQTSGRADPALALFALTAETGAFRDRGEVVLAGPGNGPRTPLATLLCTPDAPYLLASLEADDALLLIDTRPFARDPDRRNGSFGLRPTTVIRTGAGPRGIAFAGDVPFVHTWLDHALSHFRWEDARQINELAARDDLPGSYPALHTEGFAVLRD